MGRWSQYDTDDERLPNGMTRIGYDADSQTYTYRDADGAVWEGTPGNQYGPLTRVSQAPQLYDTVEEDNGPALPPPRYEADEPKVSWRHELMPLFNFFSILGLFLIGVYFLLRSTPGNKAGSTTVQCGDGYGAHTIKPGDTCWDMAEGKGVTLDALQSANRELECERLQVGDLVCVPEF